MTSVDKQVALYMHGAEFGDAQIKAMMTQELRQRLTEAAAEGRPLRVYCGYDVTAPDIHLGHTITMRKLRQFQENGHDVTFLIGTFTTLIGDPSDRDEARSRAMLEQVKKNAETYAAQAFKILDPQKTKVRYNYEWLSQLTFSDVIEMASCFTVQQFLVRDRLRNRYEKNDPIWLRELLYPLAQGYDAVSLQADVQIGATEQLFNLMAGRRLQEAYGQKPQICITYPVLVGTDGVQRMSKTTGNYIGVDEPPEQIYGKVMSIPDGLIIHYFDLLTDVPNEEMVDFRFAIDNRTINPMELKKRLAREIVTELYGKQKAAEAAGHFEKVVQNKEVPEEIEECRFSFSSTTNMFDDSEEEDKNGKLRWSGSEDWDVSYIIVKTGQAKSRSEAIRLIRQGAVSINGKKITSNMATVDSGSIIKVGKRRFVKVINTDRI